MAKKKPLQEGEWRYLKTQVVFFPLAR